MKKDFIAVSDYTPNELQDLLDLAVFLKKELQSGGNKPVLQGKVLGLIFQKPSLRTRISFEMGMRHLGGDAFISPRPKLVLDSGNPSQMLHGFFLAMSRGSWPECSTIIM